MSRSLEDLRERVLMEFGANEELANNTHSFHALEVRCPICNSRISGAEVTDYYNDINIILYSLSCEECKLDFKLEISLGE